MASEGTIYGETHNRAIMRVKWKQTEISPEKYNSKITYDIWFEKPTPVMRNPNKLTITIGNNTITQNIPGGSLTSYNMIIYTGQVYIPYNNGEAQFKIYVRMDFTYKEYEGDPVDHTGYCYVDGSGELDGFSHPWFIASSLTPVYINGTNKIRIGIDKNYSPCRHDLTFIFGTKSVSATNIDTVYEFIPPLDWLNEMPNTTFKNATVTIQAKCNGNKIGDSYSSTITLKVPENILPTVGSISDERIDGDVPAEWGIYLQSKSKAKISIVGAQGAYGSTIKKYYIKPGNESFISQEQITTNYLIKDGENQFTAYVVDSRGRKSEQKVHSIQVVKYEEPNFILAYAKRYKGEVEDDEGNNIKVKATYDYSHLDGKNSVTTKIEVRQSIGTQWINEGTISQQEQTLRNEYSSEFSWKVRFTVSDLITTNEIVIDVDTAKVLVDLKVGGNGLGIGKTAEEDILDIAMDIKCRKELEISNGDRSIKISEIIEGIGKYIKINGDASLTLSNTPQKLPFSTVEKAELQYFTTSSLPAIKILKAGLYKIELNSYLNSTNVTAAAETHIRLYINGYESDLVRYNGGTGIATRFVTLDKILKIEANDIVEIYADFSGDQGSISSYIKNSTLKIIKII